MKMQWGNIGITPDLYMIGKIYVNVNLDWIVSFGVNLDFLAFIDEDSFVKNDCFLFALLPLLSIL